MFIVLLKFAENRSLAGQFMAGHNDWLRQGFEDGIFGLSGSLQPAAGGAILAYGVSLDELQEKVARDPFVSEGVVTAEILEITPSRTDERLAFIDD